MHCIIAEKTIALVMKKTWKCQSEWISRLGSVTKTPEEAHFCFVTVLHSRQRAYF